MKKVLTSKKMRDVAMLSVLAASIAEPNGLPWLPAML